MLRAFRVLTLQLCLGLAAAAAEAQMIFPGMRLAIVSAVPGDPIASGTNLRNALAAVNPTACPGDHWLMKILPGLYDLGSTPLAMKPCVDMEGSGMAATRIRMVSVVSPNVLQTASQAELRMLAVENLNTPGGAAIRCSGGSAVLSEVAATVSSGTGGTIGIALQGGCIAMLRDVVALAAGGVETNVGISILGANVTIESSSSSASGGIGGAAAVEVTGSSLVTIRNLTAIASNTPPLGSVALRAVTPAVVAVHRSNLTGAQSVQAFAGSSVNVAVSQLAGPVSGNPTCFANYDASFAPVACP